MCTNRINLYLNTFSDFFFRRSPDSRPLPLTKWISATILAITIYFGASPFNFISRNNLELHPETNELSFNLDNVRGESSQRAIAYTIDTLSLPPKQPISIILEVTPTRIPDGLGTLIELHDGQEQPSLIVAQWQSHLAIRSRRSDSATGRMYREIGSRDCLKIGETVSLLISSSDSDTAVYVNGALTERRKGFTLIDSAASSPQIVLGTSASGEQYWIGKMKRFALYDQKVTPQTIRRGNLYPLIEYSFKETDEFVIKNTRSSEFPLQTPNRYRPLEAKRFASLADWDSSRSGQLRDAFLNVFGFVPIGLVFYIFMTRKTNSKILDFTIVAGASFVLSFAFEYAQIYLPSRSPSQLDLLGNSLGGCIAAMIAIRYGFRNKKWCL